MTTKTIRYKKYKIKQTPPFYKREGYKYSVVHKEDFGLLKRETFFITLRQAKKFIDSRIKNKLYQ